MDAEYYYNLNFETKKKPVDHTRCQDCDTELVKIEYKTVCTECGIVAENLELFIGEWRSPAQPYKRLPYFKELLNKAQGKVLVDLPDELLPKLRAEVLKNYCVWRVVTVKKVLKKLGYSEFYPDSVYLFTLLFPEKRVPKLKDEEEKWLLSGFCKIQGSWCKVKPKGRKTMLSNPYIIKKLSQLKNIPLLSECFSFPKDIRKLIEYEQVWRKLCTLFEWEFIPAF
jgi:hypothetical protein